jgi:autotransporter-associated beta strand protein
MNRITQKNSIPTSALKIAGQNGTQRLCLRFKKLASTVLAASGLLTAANSPAAQLIWDAGNTNNGATIDSASGNWDSGATNFNWNTGSGNANWLQTSTTAPLNGAVFSGPDAAAGTYQITVDGQVAWTNLQINANGYYFNGASSMFQGSLANLFVADGKSVTFSNNFAANNNSMGWTLGTGGAASALTCLGNIGGSQITFSSTNGSTFWLAGASAPSVVCINANVAQTNGTFTTGGFSIARPGFTPNFQPTAGATNAPAVFTLDGPSTVMTLSTSIQMGRNSKAQGTVNVQNGATVNMASGANNIQISSDSQANMQMAFNMYGGTVNLGTGSSSLNLLWFYKSGINSGGGGTATFTQTGGVVNAWGGIQFGTASGTVYNSGIAALTNSGGFLYIGPGGSVGITKLANSAATNYITLSGGTVGALGGWISAMPMTLATLNGNITFQTADSGGSPWNIGLSGALTGPGGFYKTGSGTLTLSGANNYAGSTVVSNGVLLIKPLLSPTNGSLTLDGSAGSPTLSLVPASAGQFMTVNGSLKFANGTPTADFNFGSLPPSTAVAPIQVANGVVCTVVPQFTVEGSAIATGKYPLIACTGGAVAGFTPTPANITLTGGSASGYVTNIANVLYLQVTSSTYNPADVWRVGSGNWDIQATANWYLFTTANHITYTNGSAAQFDDTASGPFPVTIATIATVSPNGITVTGTNIWMILDNGGAIAGTQGLAKSGSGTLTLSGTNTYSGGTMVAGGQLNINSGGDNSGLNSAIGTGSLTLDLGSKVDNTSGQSVTLVPSIAETWQDDWTYLGSTNFDTGPGAITLGSSVITLNVFSNTLAVSGPIGDNGSNYKIQKAGNGTLTLRVDNGFAGGLELVSGQLNVGSANCLGTGQTTIDGGTIDNVSGADLTLSSAASYSFPLAVNGTFTYLGTSNNLDLGGAQISIGTGASQFWNIVSNTLTLEGNLTIGNATITKIGNGTLAVIGVSSVNQASFIVNQGELDANRSVGVTFGNGGSGHGFTVQSNAVVKFLPGGDGNQIYHGSTIVPILNAGGVFDLNSQSQTVDGLAITNGVLRNSAVGEGSPSVLTIDITSSAITNAVVLGAGNNIFDVPSADGELDIAGEVTGGGSLVKTGLGIVNLFGTNSYTGNTTVSNGTLIINYPFLSTNSTVTVNTNATLGTNGVLTLNFAESETNVVAALVMGGVSKPAGVYNATTDPLYFAGTGSLLVVPLVTINPLPGTIQFNVTGGTLALSWPTNQGWILQSQTNALNVGLVANSNVWFNVPGSQLVTNTNITINPANGAVFYRMVHP